MNKQKKQEILQEIFKWNRQTIGHLNQKDVCDDIGMDYRNFNKYITWQVEPSDDRFWQIIESAKKIAKLKYNFTMNIKKV